MAAAVHSHKGNETAGVSVMFLNCGRAMVGSDNKSQTTMRIADALVDHGKDAANAQAAQVRASEKLGNEATALANRAGSE